ncbi:uncharacterized protein SAPINGB_P002423 [Magnusiomyces paraingens]|uniref:Biogenesis of lysosome-related organelles complex 1 subunit 1 n=1 Tax=Magnusiomyces paraingens TaxID=2606893 RepID=A0A5E8BJL8_9ASCO|nr:uncharacterized protein SAPINGB_P002423 [Saprochaete ingens]VVT49747.1 unnamed protein product [Saprochaete ingens]
MSNQSLTAKKLIKQAAIGQTERHATARAAQARLAADLAAVPVALEAPLVERITEIHANQRRICAQAEQLDSDVAALRKLNAKWRNLTTSTRNKLKDYGDVQNWAEIVDQDLRVIEETIKIVQTTEY